MLYVHFLTERPSMLSTLQKTDLLIHHHHLRLKQTSRMMTHISTGVEPAFHWHSESTLPVGY